MPQYSATLQSMQSRVLLQRPGLDRNLAQQFLCERVRQVLDRKPNWAGQTKRTVLSIPTAYVAGQIAVSTGSTTVIGTNTNWPVSDAVNTTVTEAVKAPGTYWTTPASLVGITRDTLLYVDSTGTPEVVPVLDILAGHIQCPFAFPHNAGFTITASSLATRQIRVNSLYPVYTVYAITSPTGMIIDNQWGNVASTGLAYEIYLGQTTFGVNAKEIVSVVDTFQGVALRLLVGQEEENLYDPTRSDTGSPTRIVSLGPNWASNMTYEIRPPWTSPGQLAVLYHEQVPDMRLPSDRPPSFLNPNIFIMGALADAFSTPCPRPPDNRDPFFSLENAQKYEARFEQAVVEAMNSDESLYQRGFDSDLTRAGGRDRSMGANWEQSHSWEAMMGDY